jgi:hypothetical protein
MSVQHAAYCECGEAMSALFLFFVILGCGYWLGRRHVADRFERRERLYQRTIDKLSAMNRALALDLAETVGTVTAEQRAIEALMGRPTYEEQP